MTKYMITGFSGFVSRYFVEFLEQSGEKTEILGLDQYPCGDDYYRSLSSAKVEFEIVDMMEGPEVAKIIDRFRPSQILHLASASSVAYSWKEPAQSFRNNTSIFLSLLEAVRQSGLQARILSVGSSEEYGNVSPDMVPITEQALLKPLSPYAVARVAQEMLSKVYADSYGMDIVMTRSFNHIGPRQKDVFVVPSLIKQVLAIKKGGQGSGRIRTGNVEITRDFLDVRDVVRAYHMLLQQGQKGEVYNVCSGQGISIKQMIKTIGEIVGVKLDIEVDPALIRPNDNKIIVGSNDKLRQVTDWGPEISLASTISDILRTAREAK